MASVDTSKLLEDNKISDASSSNLVLDLALAKSNGFAELPSSSCSSVTNGRLTCVQGEESLSNSGSSDNTCSVPRKLSVESSSVQTVKSDDEDLRYSSEDTSKGASKDRRRRQKLGNKDCLICAVCGDKANGFNFGALTCESCKAFFRRNALKNKEIACSFDNSCKIDHFTRKFCTACRLKKCFAIDMKKEWILDEDTLKKRKKLTRKKSESEQKATAPDTTVACTNGELIQPVIIGTSGLGLIEPTPQPLAEADQQAIDQILAQHKKLIDYCSDSHSSQKDANDRGYAVTDISEYCRLTDQPDHAMDILNMADGFIRKLIKFIKTLPEFKSLDQDDQISLLKGGIMETLVLRSAIQYDPNVGGFTVEDKTSSQKKDLKISFISEALGDEIYEEHMKFINSLNATANWDKPTMILAMILNLFSVDRQGLQNKQLVSQAEERYAKLLQNYLHSKYPVSEARAIYPKLLLKLTDVRSYGELSAKCIGQVTPCPNIEPLLREIFGMM